MSLVAVVAAACGGDDGGDIVVPPDTAQSGTRLKLGWIQFETGLRTWTVDIVDSALGEPCTPMVWRDGVLRCTPAMPRIAFADAACTQPMILGLEDELAASFAATDCDGTRPARMYAATDERSDVADAYEGTEDGCSRIQQPRPSGFIGRRAVAQPSPDLVTMRRAYQGTGRVRIETLTASDGLILPVQPYDMELDAACAQFDNIIFNTNGMADATSVPCVVDAVETTQFADPTCETPAVVVPDACRAPAITAEAMAGPCRPYFAVSDEPQIASYAQVASCFPTAPAPDALIYPGTEELETITFARTVEPGAGRLQLIYIGDGGVRIRERGVFFDAVLDTECLLSQVDVAAFTCIPVSRTSGPMQVFTDDQCTQSIYVTWVNNDDDTLWPCLVQKPRKYSWGGGTEVREVGGVQAGPFYSTEFGSCMAFDVINATAHLLGPPVTMPFVNATKVFD